MSGSSEIDFCDLKEGWNVFAGTCGVVVLRVRDGRCRARILGSFESVVSFEKRHPEAAEAVSTAWYRACELRASHTETNPAGTHQRPVTS